MAVVSADRLLAEAVEVARDAVLEIAEPEHIGEHLRVVAESEFLVSHIFTAHNPGYQGWVWSVGVTRAPDSDCVTINDVVMLPGERAVIAPPWTPYRERIEPGDLSPGDILPPEDDDIRLVPAWDAGGNGADALEVAYAKEVGLGRKRVLSLEGRDMAAQRWFAGEQGPDSQLAKQAPAPCRTCGFLTRLAGPLSRSFGVCANGMANDDGKVVAFEHGCGAHSDARLSRSAAPRELPDMFYDTVAVDDIEDF